MGTAVMKHVHNAFSIDEDLIRIPAEDAASICEAADLPEDALTLLQSDDRPASYLTRLLQSKRYMDALTFLAYGLPKREAVWWACVTLQRWLGDDLSEQDQRALAVVEAWIYDPSQDLCRAAGDVAAESKFQTPAALAAAGVYWAGESIAPPDCPVVPPHGQLTHKAVAHALILVLMREADAQARENATQLFLAMGIKIAQGATSRTALESVASGGSAGIDTTISACG
ncbi:MAG: DUF6931 family protein [Geminicoccaceae bacterium]